MQIDSSALAQHIISKTRKGDYLSGPDLPMLSQVKAVNALLLYNLKMAWELEAEQLKSPYFNYANEEVKQAQAKFLNVLSQHIKVSSKVAADLLANAIDDYLLADEDFIKFSVFKLEAFARPAIPLARVLELAKYAPVNKTALENIAAQLKSFGKIEVLKGDLQMSLLQLKNRQELAKSNTLADTLRNAYPDFVFEPEVKESEPETPSFFDSIDLEDKSDQELQRQDAFEMHQEEAIEPALVEPVLVNYDEGPPPFVPSEVITTEDTNQVDKEPADIYVTSNEAEPLASITVAGGAAPIITPSKKTKLAEMPRALNLRPQEENLAEKLNRTSTESSSLLNRISQTNLTGIGSSISLIDKERYISQLFAGDRDAYASAIAKLEKSASRSDAEHYMKEEMLTHEDKASANRSVRESFEKMILRKFSA